MDPENPGSKMYSEAPVDADWPDKTSSYRDKHRSYLLSARRILGFLRLLIIFFFFFSRCF